MGKTQNAIIIEGSSRANGDTNKISEALAEKLSCEIIHLSEFNISAYDYDFKNKHDDFLPLIGKVIDNYDLIIFATPVYWYSMSGTLKNFFDRITDCLKTEKDTGRKLRGKKMAAINCSSTDVEIDGFFVPFKATAGYLGMEYLGDMTSCVSKGVIPEEIQIKIENFANQLKTQEEKIEL